MKRRITFNDGSYYYGDVDSNGKMHGYGTYYFNSGARYEGDCYHGDFHGHGRYTYSDGDYFEGTYEHDKRMGWGEYHFGSGDYYEGYFNNGEYEGYGIYHYASGDRYEGAWHADKRTGLGIYTFADGEVMKGEFLDGKRNGKMHHIYTDGSESYVRYSQGEMVGTFEPSEMPDVYAAIDRLRADCERRWSRSNASYGGASRNSGGAVKEKSKINWVLAVILLLFLPPIGIIYLIVKFLGK